MLVILVFIVAGFAFGDGSRDNFSDPAVRASTTPIYSQFSVSLLFIYFAYSGWNAATYVAEELKQPARTLPLSLACGTTLVTALFIALNVVFIYAVPMESMKGEVSVGALPPRTCSAPTLPDFSAPPDAAVFDGHHERHVTMDRACITLWPKTGRFSRPRPKSTRVATPVVAIVAQGVCTMLMTVTPFVNLLLYIGLLLNFFAVLSVASLFIFRRRAGWQKLGVVSFAYPLIPAFFVLMGIWITIRAIQLRPIVSAVAALTVALGALVYQKIR